MISITVYISNLFDDVQILYYANLNVPSCQNKQMLKLCQRNA